MPLASELPTNVPERHLLAAHASVVSHPAGHGPECVDEASLEGGIAAGRDGHEAHFGGDHQVSEGG